MIFVIVPLVALTVWRYFLMARRCGRGYMLREVAAAASAGATSGVLIGLAARIGMAAIGVANGALGIIYAGLLRRILRGSGLAYGCLLVLCTWYPLAQAAVEDLSVQPAIGRLILTSGVIVAAMWVPYALVLERLMSRRQRRSKIIAGTAV